MSHFTKSFSLDSNLDQVVIDIVASSEDLDGSGLVQLFQLLSDRATEHRQILAHSARAMSSMLSGEHPVTQDSVEAQAQDTIFETRCLKLLLARVCRKLAENLEFEISEQQANLPRIKSAVYSAIGEVENFEIDS